MDKILLASNNTNKIKEFDEILKHKFELIPQSKLNINEVEETGLTFLENAILKARNATKIGNLPAIADDSGIEVDALSGRPGIFSARYAGIQKNDEENNKLLLNELIDIPFEERTARYQCVIVFMPYFDHPLPKVYCGSWEGYIGFEESGDNGFGYDPIFFLPDLGRTAAQLSEKEKNKISHRGKALNLFKIDFLG
tara:strand:- start:256 stop:843 length:588 start_codon:yes stop_codon:yes gene_type:complete